MKLSTFLESQGTYVGAKIDEDSTFELVRLQKSLRLNNPLEPKDFHTTILYSRKNIDVPVVEGSFASIGYYVDTWETKSGESVVVLKLRSERLTQRHEDLISIGGTHDYPDYSPHITLSYNDTVTPMHVDIEVTCIDEYIHELDLKNKF
jgi:hypothetical protein